MYLLIEMGVWEDFLEEVTFELRSEGRPCKAGSRAGRNNLCKCSEAGHTVWCLRT